MGGVCKWAGYASEQWQLPWICCYEIMAGDGASKRQPGRGPFNLPLPSQLIRVVTEDEIGSRELLIVGDVHGCYDELKEMMDSNGITRENTCVLFVGDLTNKGPHSIKVVQYIMENGWFSVRGNHDEISMLEQTLSKDRDPSPKFQWVTQLGKKELDWLSDLPYVLLVPTRQIIVVHAGVLPGVPLEEQDLEIFLYMRCVEQEGDKLSWTRKFCEDLRLWAEVWSGPEHIYYGHDARRLFKEFPFATALDSACVYGLHLTAVYPSNRKLLRVNAHQNYTSKDKYVTGHQECNIGDSNIHQHTI